MSKPKPGNKPDFRVHVIHKETRMTARVGSAWYKEDGTIGIALNAFTVLDNRDGQLVMTLFKADD